MGSEEMIGKRVMAKGREGIVAGISNGFIKVVFDEGDSAYCSPLNVFLMEQEDC